MDVILIVCVVKGYHECGFTVTVGKIFFLAMDRKIGSLIGNRGEAFRVVRSMRTDKNRYSLLVIDFHRFPILID